MTFINPLCTKGEKCQFSPKISVRNQEKRLRSKEFLKKEKNKEIDNLENMYGCTRHSVHETYCSTLNPCSFPITLGNGSKDSFTIRGWQLWLKQWIFTLHALYFLRVFCVSSCVLNEFIRTRGTEHPYVLFKCCGEKTKFFSKHVHVTEMSHRSPRWLCYRSNLISGSIFLTWVDSQVPLFPSPNSWIIRARRQRKWRIKLG